MAEICHHILHGVKFSYFSESDATEKIVGFLKIVFFFFFFFFLVRFLNVLEFRSFRFFSGNHKHGFKVIISKG